MYPAWLTRFILAIAVIVMPLQAVAGTVAALLCMPHSHGVMLRGADAHHSERHDAGDPHALGADHQHTGAPDQGNSSPIDNSCCKVIVLSALPPSALALQMAQFTALAATPEIFH